jgi:hypothetical protein
MSESTPGFARLAAEIAATQDRAGAAERLAAAVKLRLSTPPRRRARWALVTAAGVATSALGLAWQLRPATFGFVGAAGPGEAGSVVAASTPETLRFSDGSVVELGAGAAARVVGWDATTASVLLERGELRASLVATERRWTLRAGGFRVHVLGARFTLRWDPARRRGHVAVEQGALRVEGPGVRSRVLAASDVLALGEAPEPTSVPAVAPAAAAPPARAKPLGPRRERVLADPGALLAAADDARAAGRNDDAAAALRRFVTEHGADARAPVAWFTLGRVEGERGRHADAARAFERAASYGARLAVLEDALAAVALSWARAGDATRARAAAVRYLAAFPAGAYGSKLQAIRDGGPPAR